MGTQTVDTDTGEIVEGEVVEEQHAPRPVTALAVAPQHANVLLFGTTDPNEIIASATAKANALAKVVEDRKLYTDIQGKKHVRVEGWQMLGALLGVFPSVKSRPLYGPDGEKLGWEATCEARTIGGDLVGSADSQCTRDEPPGRNGRENRWLNAPDYAVRSMAQTRATSKALRLALGFVMSLAGFDTTPAEEMDGIAGASDAPAAKSTRRRKGTDEDEPATPEQRNAVVKAAQAIGIGEGLEGDELGEALRSAITDIVGDPLFEVNERKVYSDKQCKAALKELRARAKKAGAEEPTETPAADTAPQEPEVAPLVPWVLEDGDQALIVSDETMKRLEFLYQHEDRIWDRARELWGEPDGALSEAAGQALIEDITPKPKEKAKRAAKK